MAERIAINEAAQLLRITWRQVFRLLEAYHADGPAALVSSRRGKPSNRSYPAALLSFPGQPSKRKDRAAARVTSPTKTIGDLSNGF
jgi:hypothetical protein